MSISLIFYLISVLHNLDCILALFIIFIVIVGLLVLINFFIRYADRDCSDRYEQRFISTRDFVFKHVKCYVSILIAICFINCLIPSTLTMYSLVGINYLSDSKIPQKVINLVNLKLDEYIENQIAPKKDSK